MHPTKSLKGLKSDLLLNKKIVVAVTSSIAAIEAPKLMRELIRHGAEVHCIMTEETKDIIGKYALEFGCGNEVIDKITGKIEHVSIYNECDGMIIFPATANIISKVSLNIADNIVNTTAMMFLEKKPIIIAPSMHQNMLDTVKGHLKNLSEKRNVHVMNSKLEEEKAKAISIEEVVNLTILVFSDKKAEKERKKVLILGGGTVEPIDKVRVITNLSSGKTCFSLSESFCKAGYHVEVIKGLGKDVPYYIKSYEVLTANSMLKKALEVGKDFDIIISCAAISDYTPEITIDGKIDSEISEQTLKLVKTPKVLNELRKKFPKKIIIGYKAEYGLNNEELTEKALDRLNKYNLNLIIANDLSKHYFGDDSTEVFFITKKSIEREYGSKNKISEKIVEIVNKL
ncbi:phosphopantothenoylcysteine decarboxylase/phosphopantothenate--cysteine ligase [Methanococcus vannielii SB]|uniref:Coenzyme A biosynthesis bifunctional protein CoaBC n=1 Tax=Methanococcus vannielii (strain ATCC 35089 / DSM 1224 / JCM 13029 / OCM 148 / SB) TaxID=406327 RepID=A6UQQ0_METVS|nr:bifunctional phosphopantothenoylcysteine decarboxylase/phosphopantothenate--cysteine ligase CoaBC [Methanococcus vannielii]ABR54822.1 phosphopantothenoylcysteine decarboxylase/phosphopantothenate--cysteine ligase [Methanococcus vannielii SB]